MSATDVNDRGAEQSMLGTVMMAPDPSAAAELLFGIAPAGEFWAERQIAEVLEGMWHAQKPIDPQLVLGELASRGILEKVGGGPHLHTMIERAWNPENAKFYADAIHEMWRRRSLGQAAMRTLQQVENLTTDIGEAAIELMDAAERSHHNAKRLHVGPPQDVLDFIQGPSTYDWVIPGLVERLDRVMLVAQEGLAKSVVLAQIAVAAAVGLNPFTLEEIEPKRALVIDCEVSPRQQRRRWKWMLDCAAALGRPVQPGMLRIEPRPDGLDLVGDDLAWTKAKVRSSAADIVVIGPLYRLHKHNINDEEVARELVSALDDIRISSNVALLIEAHAGHGKTGFKGERDLRPRGSSLFLGWTEFGCALRPVKGDRRIVDVVRWRGDRDIRHWPERLRWGTGLTFPWVECSPDESEWTDPA